MYDKNRQRKADEIEKDVELEGQWGNNMEVPV